MTIPQYIEQVQKLYKTGLSSEHSYRGDLRTLLESIVPRVMVTNEPKRIACGAPDYIITRNEIPVGYIEAKDLGKDLSHKDYKEQFARYKKSLNNLIITDYLDFWLFIDGELKTKLKIAEIVDHQIKPIPDNFEQFNALIKSFCTHVGQTIKSASKLSVMMADKAKLLAEVIESALNSDVENEDDSSLKEQMYAFKDILIHDITPREFADIYAQTIAYGMFAARLHDTTLDTFTRQEAAELIPKTNPFLRKLFQYVAGYDLDSRIVWIVDALADIFRATDVAALLQNFGKATQMNDPIIHFYETFLAEYDPALRKSRGVWYTPEPVVNFIVRAVDDILKTEFNLPNGLADNSKIKVKQKSFTKATTDQRSKIKEVETEVEVHKVQILDPATGTGTFLAEVVKQVYSKFKGQQGIWSNYAENHLIPRLNGFELLMASYAMAHLKLDMLLAETGFKSTKNQRFRVYLTNSLEEHHQDTGTLFANWLSSEANEANHIKRDTPVMVVLGNPPYAVSSSNKSDWIEKLVADYKKNLNERNIQPLSDDYVKFIRFGQYFIDKQEEGILAYISNNSFIDGVIHRQMRNSLLESFDKLYILDLHGSSKRKEKDVDGSKDENIFGILPGVSINIFIKNSGIIDKSVNFHDVLGTKKHKFSFLTNNTIASIKWEKLKPQPPKYQFTPFNNSETLSWDKFIDLNLLFRIKGNGIKFRKDNLLVKNHYTIADVKTMISDVNNQSSDFVYRKYDFTFTDDWNLEEKKQLFENALESDIIKIDYRLFDDRFTYYPIEKINQIIVRGDSRKNLFKNFINKRNTSLLIGRQGQVVGNMQWNLIFLSDAPTDMNIFYRGGALNLPIYIYPEDFNSTIFETDHLKVSNFNKEIIQVLCEILHLEFKVEREENENSFDSMDILDYIYSILHSPTYREKYKEFLKSDFPRVPYPRDKNSFWELVKFGSQLRALHLLESKEVDNYITSYPQDGNNVITNIKYDEGKVYINETQYFDNMPEIAWQFYIGGYQPAQKWLKDRKGRELSFDDILHYQRMIVALDETDRLMKEIDKIEFE